MIMKMPPEFRGHRFFNFRRIFSNHLLFSIADILVSFAVFLLVNSTLLVSFTLLLVNAAVLLVNSTLLVNFALLLVNFADLLVNSTLLVSFPLLLGTCMQTSRWDN
ncbi:hypothetical protein SRABI134_03975 [Peribacillus sp. Bi134]|nr:hypothetical protein SRABI134_03975 [Peribacillus sp. Bi134]